MITVPTASQKISDRWLLAHKLLLQSLTDLKIFIGGDSDAIIDARMNLGESINQATIARTPEPPKLPELPKIPSATTKTVGR
jgi:hypothetical protein